MTKKYLYHPKKFLINEVINGIVKTRNSPVNFFLTFVTFKQLFFLWRKWVLNGIVKTRDSPVNFFLTLVTFKQLFFLLRKWVFKDFFATQLDIHERRWKRKWLFLKYQWQTFVLDGTSQTLLSLDLSVILLCITLCPFNHEFKSRNKHLDTKNSPYKDHWELPLLRTLVFLLFWWTHKQSLSYS